MTNRGRLPQEREELPEWEATLLHKVADIKAGRRRTYTLDEVEAELDLAE